MNNICQKLFSILFLIFTACIQCQSVFSQVHSLEEGKRWSKLLKTNNQCYLFCFDKENVLMQKVGEKKTTLFKGLEKKNFVTISESRVYFSTIANMDSGDTEANDILVYDFAGNQLRTIRCSYYGYVFDVISNSKKSPLVIASIDFNKFSEGKSNGVMHGGVYHVGFTQPLIQFAFKQSPPPLRISMPVIAIHKKVYVASENNYVISVYSLKGKEESKISLPGYTNKPYSKEEYNLLPQMTKSTITIGVTQPPVIRKIEIDNKGRILVTRYSRPGSGIILIDVFGSDGRFLFTIELQYESKDRILDSCVSEQGIVHCLLEQQKSGKRYIQTFHNYLR